MCCSLTQLVLFVCVCVFCGSQDIADLKFGIAHGVDMVAVSFVKSAADIQFVSRVMAPLLPHPLPLIAKIELPDAMRNIKGIIDASDGIMVARGDLGACPRVHKRLGCVKLRSCTFTFEPQCFVQ